jgi:hypothetical protein
VNARHLMVVAYEAVPGREDELERWYDDHLARVTQVEGLVAAQRYEVVRGPDGADVSGRRTAIYEIDADRVDDVLAALTLARPAMPDTDAFAAPPMVWFLSARGDRAQRDRSR